MKYLIKKNGMFYRRNACGYTDFISHAGVFDEDYAKISANSCDELSIMPVSEISKVEISSIEQQILTAQAVLNAIDDGLNETPF